MKKSLKDILVITDLDNTLLTAKEGIPAYNIEMIEKFQSLGGRFTTATGRNVEAVSRLLGKVKFNAPAITYNGGVIYDFASGRILYRKVLPESVKDVLRDILEKFPDVGCEVMCDNFRAYLIRENEYTTEHFIEEKIGYIDTEIENITNNWIKVLFAGNHDLLLEMQKYCEGLNCDDLDFILTNTMYFEIMPKGISKGKALDNLCRLMDLSRENTIVIGDYYNDLEILKNAGLSVCVDNAPDDVKKICRLVVPSCTDGGVGYLLAQIIDSYN
mgnify:FL=1